MHTYIATGLQKDILVLKGHSHEKICKLGIWRDALGFKLKR
jgi:hypothetical protein